MLRLMPPHEVGWLNQLLHGVRNSHVRRELRANKLGILDDSRGDCIHRPRTILKLRALALPIVVRACALGCYLMLPTRGRWRSHLYFAGLPTSKHE